MMTQQKNQNPNGVKRNAKSSSRTSPGGRLSTQQGTFDRHPLTFDCLQHKGENEELCIRLENIVLETKRMGIDIMGWQRLDGCSLGR